jgi:hypothetical protein
VKFEGAISENSQTRTQKLLDSTYVIYLVIELTETKSRMVLTRAYRSLEGGLLLFNGYRILVWEEEKIVEMDRGGGGV